MSFSTDDVTVTLKGAEWAAIIARIDFLLAGKPVLESTDTFSRKGARVYKDAMAGLKDQILSAATAPKRKTDAAS